VGVATKKEKLNVGFEPPCEYYKKRKKKTNVCFEPHVSIVIEKENFNVFCQ